MSALHSESPEPAFDVLTESHGPVLVIRASGELDIASAKSLEKEIRAGFAGEAEAVLLDLDEVSFIDSTGISVLLAAATMSSSNGQRLRLVRISPSVRRAFEVSGLEGAFPLTD